MRLAPAIAAAMLAAVPAVAQSPSAALIEARSRVADPALSPVTFRAMAQFFPSEGVAAGRRIAPLPRGAAMARPAVTLRGTAVDFDEALRRTHTNALLVIKGGRIVHEQYLNGGGPADRYMSWSIAKSVTAILTGIAIERGVIAGLGDPIDRYLPALAGTPYEGVSIENMLQMREGSSYAEIRPDGSSDTETLRRRATYANSARFTDFSGLGLTRKHPPGAVFNYATLTSGLIAAALEAASGKSLARLTEDWLWKPAGMEASAHWLLDGPPPAGRAIGGGAFNAVLRDYGRIGQMMLDGGRLGGRQVVSRDWVKRSATDVHGVQIPEEGRGYNLHWWTTPAAGRFEAIGIHGQFISIDPASDSVIVKLSHWPDKGGLDYELDTLALFDAIRRAIG